MEQFQTFLQKAKQAREFTSYNSIHLVLGNESCDLDSTVSALALAYLIHYQKCTSLVIPIMNVEAKYFPLRTETCYLLKKYGIDPNLLIFKDQIDYANLLKTGKLFTSLVDHHVLSSHDKVLEKTVVQIFDHRPINEEEICQGEHIEKTVIKIVGSCATLVANEILSCNPSILFSELSHLLYATIIYDTIGLNKEHGKTFDEDLTVAQRLEDILKTSPNRKDLFDLLWKVHNDSSTLTTKDLLYRDLKIVKGIPIPGLPMLVEDYLKREDAYNALTTFITENKSASAVVIGIDASKGVRRDVAIFSTDSHFKNTLINILKNSQQIAGSDLMLTEVVTKNESVVCFSQGNIKLTRKFILPLVNQAASECKS
ncbi:exopolyphosphatase PRUNE1 [Zophobas morio]|uniref:exopolyphosphatase PRUNE1 n=1 Tax=Zophobas morio TaxID=2755281 RepID=UPI003082B280